MRTYPLISRKGRKQMDSFETHCFRPFTRLLHVSCGCDRFDLFGIAAELFQIESALFILLFPKIGHMLDLFGIVAEIREKIFILLIVGRDVFGVNERIVFHFSLAFRKEEKPNETAFLPNHWA